ncbi:MAG: hypothetical protein GY849_17515 [Deltaproteobacteria bacterium]|nr:hypothetical protein [Deltaproteobacteria bacterium]
MLSLKKLKNSNEFKTWVTGRISLIHDVYGDNYAFIVIHSDMGKFTITSFFGTQNKIQVSNDFVNISTDEVFQKIISDYTSTLV